RGPVVDGSSVTRLVDQEPVCTEGYRVPRRQNLADWIGDRLPVLFLDSPEDFSQISLEGVGLRPSRQPFGLRVHEANAPLLVGGDHAITDTSQSGLEPLFVLPQPSLHRMSEKPDFDGDLEILVVERFQDVAVRSG